MLGWVTETLENILDFSNTLNASIAASWLIIAIMALRFLLKRAPKWTHVALWGLVAVRLLVPFSIESAFSIIPSAEIIPQEILRYEGTQRQEAAHLDVVSNPLYSNGLTIELEQTIDRVQVHMVYMTLIWFAGIAVLFLYTGITYWQLRRRVDITVWYRDNILQCENISSPFVLGIINPKIYLPLGLDEQDVEHIIAHEQAHIRRKDHWWKLLGFLLLIFHWFNPLMWLAFALLCRDIELACDEKVIKALNNERRADYAQVLVACSVSHRATAACPLAFGEVGVKERVKNIINYKKPTFWIILLTLIAFVAVVICFMTNPMEPTIGYILSNDNYTVLSQEQVDLTLTISKAALPDDIYTSAGHEFGKEEVIVYQTETTTIYLYKAMLSNESDEQLYFMFDISYNFPNSGTVLSAIEYNDRGFRHIIQLRSKDLRDDVNIYPDALHMRAHGPGSQFAFYVSVDACKAAEGNVFIDVVCNEVSYTN